MAQITQRVLSEEVLDKTMQLFWEKGFFNTSIEEILEVTGFNRAAIYKHFGDKKGLFLAMLKRYRAQITPKLTLPLTNQNQGFDAIKTFLMQFVQLRQSNSLLYGCFLISTASDLPSHSQEVSALIQDFIDYLHQLFLNIFDHMKSEKELSSDVDSKALADYMIGNVFGLLTLCRTDASKGVVENQIQAILNFLTTLSIKKKYPNTKKDLLTTKRS